MKILALEFSTDERSVAVGNKPEDATQVDILSEVVAQGTREVKPFAMIREALRQAGVDRSQIALLAVGLGPGSYTGIRLAISLAQGWQLAQAPACVTGSSAAPAPGKDLRPSVLTTGISSVDCLAAQARASSLFGVVRLLIDAQRNEFYTATYEVAANSLRLLEPLHLVSFEQVKTPRAGEILAGPDAGRVAGARRLIPRAAVLAQLAGKHRDFPPASALEPIYLRPAAFVKAPPPNYEL